MPRLKQSARAPALAHLRGRPGRGRLLWRRLRHWAWPASVLCVVLMVGFAGYSGVRALGPTGSFSERLLLATTRLGFSVQRVIIEGRQKTPEPMVRAALGVRTGDPILGFSLDQARARMETINWVQGATVERRLPGTIVVQLRERRPFAVWQHQGRFVLIDHDGNTVTDSDVASFASQVPLVVGAGAPAAAGSLLDTLASYPLIMSRMVAAVRVGERRWNLRMNNGADILLPEGGEVPALTRLMELQSTHALLDRPLQVVDLRLPDRLVVRPQPVRTETNCDSATPERGCRGDTDKPGHKPT